MGYLKLSNFRGQAGPVISRRGREYWEEGRVEITESDGKNFVATIRGTEDYITTAKIDGDEILNISCTCPYDRGICKHEVALLLEIKNRMSKEKMTKEIIKDKQYEIEGEQVSEKEFFLLTFLACSDGSSIRNLGYHSVPVGKGWKSTATERSKLLEKLSRQGLLERYYASYYDLEYRVIESKKYLIIKNTVLQRPDWITYLDKEYYLRDSSRYIIQIAEMMTGKRSKITTPFPGETTDIFCLKYAVIQEDKEKILKALDPSFLILLLNTLSDEALEFGRHSYLEKIKDILFSISERKSDWDVAEHHLRLTTLYSKGQLLPVSNPQATSSYLNYTEAVISLYKGDLDAAIQSFQKGLSLKKGAKIWKIIPIESISFLLYVIALGLRRQDKDIQTLQKINSYSSHKDCSWLRPIFTLADFFSTPSQPKNTNLLLEFIQGPSPRIPCIRDICVLLLRFFQQSDSNLGQFSYTLSTSHSVLLHEISAFGEENTVQNWPWGPALLARIKPKEFWELELQDIIRIATASTKLGTPAEGKEATGRLAYVVCRYFSEYSLEDIRQQNRLKNGAWSKGKKLSYIRYQEGDMQMDSIDAQIYEI